MDVVIPIIITAALLAIPGPDHPNHAELATSQVPGTYDVLICKGSCAFGSAENVLVRGTVVLKHEPYSQSEFPERARKNFRSGFSLVGPTNGCFVLETLEKGRGDVPLSVER